MLDKIIFKLMSNKEREKFLWDFHKKVGTDTYVDFIRDFSLNPKSSSRLMKEFRKWLRNKKSY